MVRRTLVSAVGVNLAMMAKDGAAGLMSLAERQPLFLFALCYIVWRLRGIVDVVEVVNRGTGICVIEDSTPTVQSADLFTLKKSFATDMSLRRGALTHLLPYIPQIIYSFTLLLQWL